MVKFPLKEIQSTRTQRPTASSSYPYVEITLGDVAAQRTMQLQLEQVGPDLPPRPCQPASASLIELTRLFSGRACLQDWSGPGHASGSIQPGAGDRSNPTLHSTVDHYSGLPVKHLGGGLVGKGPGCLQNSEEFDGELGRHTQGRGGLEGP